MKNLLTLLFIAAAAQVNAQNEIIINYSATNPTAPLTCDGTVTINSVTNGVAPYTMNWYEPSGMMYTTTSTSFSNLCAGYYWVELFDANCNVAYLDINLETNSGNPTPVSFSSLSFNYESSAGACDGDYNFDISGATGPMGYMVSDAYFGTQFVNVPVGSFPVSSSSVCLNDTTGIWISVFDSTNAFYLNYMAINMNSWGYGYYCMGNLYGYVQPIPASDSSTCNGGAGAVVWGGTPPYQFYYSNGDTTSTTSGLCSGWYSLDIVDANASVFNTSFVIADSNNIYSSYFWANPYDTLYTNAVQNCDLDLTQPIDSVVIDSVHYVSAWEVSVTYIVYQDTVTVYWTEEYYVDTTAYFAVSLSVYCQNRADAAIMLFGMIDLTDPFGSTGTNHAEPAMLTQFNLWPNPTTHWVTASFRSPAEGQWKYEITDVSGKIVDAQSRSIHTGLNNVQFDVSTLSNGMYIVSSWINGVKTKSTRFIKE